MGGYLGLGQREVGFGGLGGLYSELELKAEGLHIWIWIFGVMGSKGLWERQLGPFWGLHNSGWGRWPALLGSCGLLCHTPFLSQSFHTWHRAMLSHLCPPSPGCLFPTVSLSLPASLRPL